MFLAVEEGALAEFGVKTARREEVGVLTTFDDASVFHHEDLVRAANRAQAVRDDEAGAAPHELVQRTLDSALGLRVHAGGRLIEDEDGRVLQECAGDGNTLFFADAELHAALTDDGAKAIGHPFDEGAGVGGFSGGEEFVVGRAGAAQAEVVTHRAVEEEALLRDEADGTAQLRAWDVREQPTVNADLTAGVFVEAREQVDEGGLARAGRPDEGDRLPGAGVERDVLEDGGAPRHRRNRRC